MQHKKVLTKVKRVIKEIYILKEREYSVPEFVALFNVERRTIQRDLNDIRKIGFNLELTKRGTYRIYKEISEVEIKDEIVKAQEKKYREKQIVKSKDDEFKWFNVFTKDTAYLRQDKGQKWFYYIKDVAGQIKYMSEKFDTRQKAKIDLRLAL